MKNKNIVVITFCSLQILIDLSGAKRQYLQMQKLSKMSNYQKNVCAPFVAINNFENSTSNVAKPAARACFCKSSNHNLLACAPKTTVLRKVFLPLPPGGGRNALVLRIFGCTAWIWTFNNISIIVRFIFVFIRQEIYQFNKCSF